MSYSVVLFCAPNCMVHDTCHKIHCLEKLEPDEEIKVFGPYLDLKTAEEASKRIKSQHNDQNDYENDEYRIGLRMYVL